MITAWDVYWVMQMDMVGSVAGFFCTVGTFCGAIGMFFCRAMSMGECEEIKSNLIRLSDVFKRLMMLGLVCIPLRTFLPSSQTAAAMIILPAVTSQEVTGPVSQEFSELYKLAKDALRNVAEKRNDDGDENASGH